MSMINTIPTTTILDRKRSKRHLADSSEPCSSSSHSSVKKAKAAPTTARKTKRQAKSYDAFKFETSFVERYDPLKRTATVVVGDGNLANPFETVKIVPKFLSNLPSLCKEALRAHHNGSTPFPNNVPGIPASKFAGTDPWIPTQKYEVQGMYEVKNSRTKMQLQYEGWDSETITTQTETSILESSAIRSNFLESLRGYVDDNQANLINDYRYLTKELIKDPQNKFWLYEDLSYFHSRLQKEQGMAPVFYFCMQADPVKPPTCSYTTANVMPQKVMDYLLGCKQNKRFVELTGRAANKQQATGSCENPEKCVCDQTKKILYKEKAINLVPNADGLLNLENVGVSDEKIVMECSDACGCSMQCPRRQLQRGQQKALVVFYEGEGFGFGVRAGEDIKAGELLCEYTGEVFRDSETRESCSTDEERDQFDRLRSDTSYDIGFSVMNKDVVISAKYAGNVARYFNHCCSSNAMFIETHTRVTESEPLVPRVAVYASKDIKAGEKITITYWDIQDYKRKFRYSCRCGAATCIRWLPAPFR
ncbi:unnamed protein product [Caenorhabditis brenneri]